MREIKVPLSLPFLNKDEEQAVIEVLRSGWLAPGDYNKKFETEMANFIGVKHAITMNSCASALEVALKVGDIKGGEVIIPSFTFVATANAVVQAGATPVFCDVDLETRNVTAKNIETCINEKTKAVIVVHYGGQVCQMTEIVDLCKKYNLFLIEDCAETLGSTWQGRQAGSFGIGCFSFFPTKNITTGEGGMITCNDDRYAEKVRTLISHGVPSGGEKKYPWLRSAVMAGHNYRLSNILAAIGYHQFKKLHLMNNKRQKLARYYDRRINELNLPIITPKVQNGATHVYQMYTIQVPEEKRNNIVLTLIDKGIGASVHFDPPVHRQDFYRQYASNKNNLKNTEKLARCLITLPIYPGLRFEEIDYVVEQLRQAFNYV